jgi:hypothetical protein
VSVRPRLRTSIRTALAISGLAALVVPTTALAADGSEQQLARKYAPVVGLKEHEPCAETGEPYRPVPVEMVLGQPDIVLLGPDGAVVKKAPTAADLYGKGDGYWLDFPGDPLDAGCTYEQWFNRIAAGKPTTAYAHIVGEQGKLALQYWFYYPFNDWNNKHESDWEMIQLVFDAPTAEDALKQSPALVGYSQHEGAESATWDDEKLEKRGEHPVVYPGAGSHANQFVQSLYLGHSAQTGFGCDDTRGPTRYEQTQVVLTPTKPTGPDDRFAWVSYLGHWGQEVSGPNSGPTGPTFKSQWTEPITWVDEEWRSDNVQVPAASTVAPSATGFFCTAVAKGSEIYIRFLRNPFVVLGILAAIVLFAVWLSRRTNWSPALPHPIRQRRDVGEIYRSGFRVYRGRPALFIGIGLMAIPFGVLSAIAQNILFRVTGLSALTDVAVEDPVVGALAAVIFGAFTTLVAAMLVYAACAEALERIDEGEQPDLLDAYRGVLAVLLPLAWATLRMTIVAGVLVITVIGIPFAVVYLIRKAVTVQSIVIEERGGTSGLRRSGELVRGSELRVFGVGALVNGTVALLGPVIGVVMMFITPASLGFINLVAAVVYVFVLPAAGIIIALLFFDLRIRKEGVQTVTAPIESEQRPDSPGEAGARPEPQGA